MMVLNSLAHTAIRFIFNQNNMHLHTRSRAREFALEFYVNGENEA